ncbi:prepilin peptidase [Salmonella enterica subsp. enterica serovar Newport]|nr:prepilin peptidase [Salmonella enterica subsp. enterica serovar Newport]
MDVDFSALFTGFCLRGSCLWVGGDIANEEGIAADVPGDGAVTVNAAGRAHTTLVPGQTTMQPGVLPVKTLIATALPVEYALPVMMSAALMSRLILIPVRRFLAGQGCGVNARMRTAEATGIWAMAVAAMLFCLAQAPFAERLHALLMSGFLLQLGVCDAVSGWLPRQMTVAFLAAGVLASGITEPPVVILVHGAVTVLISVILLHLLMRNKHQGTCRRLGTGDLWMMTGMVAWLGLPDAVTAMMVALTTFVAWHLAVGTGMRGGGPLGPWLSAGCVLILIHRLYQPLWVM